MANAGLPSFEHPPVVETVLGVQFDRLPKFTNAHLGAFWKWVEALKVEKWKSLAAEQWDEVLDVPSLDPALEEFGDERAWSAIGAQLKLTQDPSTRLQIRNESRDRMIQIQNGRIHYNWLRQPGAEYPRYEKTIRPAFIEVLKALRTFVANESLGELRLNQWEVTYVNHFPKGSVWNTPNDWAGLFRSLPVSPSSADVACLETFAGAWHYEIPPRRGRLHVEVRHGVSPPPEHEQALKMKLTARGPMCSGANGNAENGAAECDGLDLGRETIVRMFKNLTSPEAHKHWGLEHERS